MYGIRLRTEHLKNPIGIDKWQPWLHWNCSEGIKQTAYGYTARSMSCISGIYGYA